MDKEGGFGEDPETTELHKIESEITRIEQGLRQHMSAEQAAEIARKIFEIAVRINEINKQILTDPRIIKNYVRKENLLIKRGSKTGMSSLPDASYILESIRDSLDKPERFLEWLREKRQVAEDRLTMLRKTGDIAFVSGDTIGEIQEFEKETEKKEVEKYIDKLIKDENDEDA